MINKIFALNVILAKVMQENLDTMLVKQCVAMPISAIVHNLTN